jgi:hypothetical protein
MKKVFISSVITDFEEYRQAAKRAVEIMGNRPVMSEVSGARPYSPEKACVTEVETSDVYIVILGKKYGFITPKGISVTHTEYRAARDSDKPILAFMKRCKMEAKQEKFRQEVEEYQKGFFRAGFETPEELKEEIIKSLRLLDQMQSAVSEDVFKENLKQRLSSVSDYTYYHNGPQLSIGIWPNPPKDVDIVEIEHKLDSIFTVMCQGGLALMRDGYEPIRQRGWTGMKSGKNVIAFFADGLILLTLSPVIEQENFHFSSHFAPPSRIKQFAIAARQFIESNSCWIHIGLKEMNYTSVKELSERNMNGGITMRPFGENEADFQKLFVPFTEQEYNKWIEQCIRRFQRIFS